MSGRITQLMSSSSILADLQAVTSQLDETQRKISSGKELTRPSDNPFAVARALDYRSELTANMKHQDNVAEAHAWQTITDVSLGRIGDLTQRARELLIQASNDTVSPNGRGAIALEIETIVESIKSQANAQYAGRYVLSGSATLTSPYTPGGADTFNGNSEAITREIGPGVQIQVNSVAATVIGDGSTGLIGALRQIAVNLYANDGNALRDTDLAALTAASDALQNERAVVGARTNRLGAASGRLEELEGVTRGLLSETEDADVAETLIRLTQQQSAYQSALRAGAQIMQSSLIDFLR